MLTYARDGTATIAVCLSFFCSAFAKRVHNAYKNVKRFAICVAVNCQLFAACAILLKAVSLMLG